LFPGDSLSVTFEPVCAGLTVINRNVPELVKLQIGDSSTDTWEWEHIVQIPYLSFLELGVEPGTYDIQLTDLNGLKASFLSVCLTFNEMSYIIHGSI
ncbi:MAG: hypothetical protein K8S56_08645, partial [Candidatus Cloacimonetes bacterium]|nr:hypothetical protein [Candidatus Cloacimonadota bacterium]